MKKGTQKFSYATGTSSIITPETPYFQQKDVQIHEGSSLDLSCHEHDLIRKDHSIVWVKVGHINNFFLYFKNFNTKLQDNQPLSAFVTNKILITTTTSQNEGLYRCFINGKEVMRYNVIVVPQLRPVRHQSDSCSNWTDFTPCSVTCGTGFRTRTRNCLLPRKNCNETNFEVQLCHNPHSCASIASHVPPPLRTGPEQIEWMGRSFAPYKDTEYNENGINHCTEGFTLDIFNKRCVDINECRLRNKCPKGLKCVNTRGSYNCVTCPKGYMGINERCLGKSNFCCF